MITRPALAAAFALAGVSATACGGADPSGEVAAVFRGWFRDVVEGNGKRACNRLTPNARRQLLDLHPDGDDLGCERLVVALSETLSADVKRAVARMRVRDVAVHGDRAEIRDEDLEFEWPLVRMSEPTSKAPAVLLRSDGTWVLEDLG